MSGKKSSEFAVIARTSSLLDSFKSEIDNYKLFRKDILKNFDKVEFSKINCLTAHASKGLEFSVVVILGAEEGFFPHYNAQTSAAILDELRLFYVAVTRCKDSLLFTSVNARLTSNTARFNQTKSRYLRQMPENLLNDAHLLNVPIFEGFKVGTKVIYNEKKGRIITLLERSAICKIRGMKQGAIKYDDLQII